MRASRETELVQTYPLHVVTAWIGNSARVAAKHYLQVTDADFERAAADGLSADSPVECAAGRCTRRCRIRRSLGAPTGVRRGQWYRQAKKKAGEFTSPEKPEDIC